MYNASVREKRFWRRFEQQKLLKRMEVTLDKKQHVGDVSITVNNR